MKKYIGTKTLLAISMTRGGYNEYRGWPAVKDENPEDEGYLVEYLDSGPPNDSRHAGYISWSPKEVFEKHYHAFEGLTFGMAIEALKAGKRVCRAGWNGKGMWLSLSCDGSRTIPAENFWSPHNRRFAEENGGKATVLPSITMKTATNEILMGWLASQTDILAEDWQILEPVIQENVREG